MSESTWISVHVPVASLDGPVVDQALSDIDGALRAVLDCNSGLKWFFVRYSENGPHLRLRFCVDNEQLSELREEICQRLVDWSAREVPYVAEVERYGGASAILKCELVFDASSRLVVGQLSERQRPFDYSERLWLAAAGSLVIASAFASDIVQLRAICERLATGMVSLLSPRLHLDCEEAAAMLGSSLPLNDALLDAIVNGRLDAAHQALRSASIASARCLRSERSVDPQAVCCSLIHMHFNRLGLVRFDEALVSIALSLRLRTIQAELQPSCDVGAGEHRPEVHIH